MSEYVFADALMIRKVMARYLLAKSIVAESACDGQQACDTVALKGVNYYDLILMDYTMPIMVRAFLQVLDSLVNHFAVCILFSLFRMEAMLATPFA